MFVAITKTLTMMLTSAMTKLLWILRYPSFPSDVLGPYKNIGTIQTRIPGSTNCQILYPSTTGQQQQVVHDDDDNSIGTGSSSSSSGKKRSKNNNSFHPYWRPQAVEGLADYSRVNTNLLKFLSNRVHPCRLVQGAPVLLRRRVNSSSDSDGGGGGGGGGGSTSGGFPVVVFSHGLGGCMEMYTTLCQQIASYGYVVIALEHEDGSGCYAESENGHSIFYRRPNTDTPYSRERVVNFRRPFLKQRVLETTTAIEYLFQTATAMKKNPTSDKSVITAADSQLLQRLIQVSADPFKGVALLGHSFGAASMALTAQDVTSRKTQHTTPPILALGMMDPWAFSLEDDVLNRGIPSCIPALSVLSEAWLSNPEREQVKQLLVNSSGKEENITSLYARNSVHTSFSDVVGWLPRFLLRKMRLLGRKEKRYETIHSVAKAYVRHMQQQQQQQQQQQNARCSMNGVYYGSLANKRDEEHDFGSLEALPVHKIFTESSVPKEAAIPS